MKTKLSAITVTLGALGVLLYVIGQIGWWSLSREIRHRGLFVEGDLDGLYDHLQSQMPGSPLPFFWKISWPIQLLGAILLFCGYLVWAARVTPRNLRTAGLVIFALGVVVDFIPGLGPLLLYPIVPCLLVTAIVLILHAGRTIFTRHWPDGSTTLPNNT